LTITITLALRGYYPVARTERPGRIAKKASGR